MVEDEAKLRESLVRWGRSLFERRFTVGSSGNISVKLADGFLSTPTNSCLGFLEANRLSRLDGSGRHIEGDPPTKELPLHMAFYEGRSSAKAVVHLHSTYATALSCLADIDPENAIAPITPYVVMRVRSRAGSALHETWIHRNRSRHSRKGSAQCGRAPRQSRAGRRRHLP